MPAVAWAALIFAASSRHAVPMPSVWGFDKLSHFGVYLVLGALLVWAAARTGVPIGLALAAGLVYAASDEWHQSFVPGRTPDIADWVADALGVGAGGTAVRRWLPRAA